MSGFGNISALNEVKQLLHFWLNLSLITLKSMNSQYSLIHIEIVLNVHTSIL